MHWCSVLCCWRDNSYTKTQMLTTAAFSLLSDCISLPVTLYQTEDAFRTFISTRISQLLTQECVSHFGSYEKQLAKNCFVMTD